MFEKSVIDCFFLIRFSFCSSSFTELIMNDFSCMQITNTQLYTNVNVCDLVKEMAQTQLPVEVCTGSHNIL